MPWFFPPSSMVARHGHCIAAISRNWSSSTCELSAPSWESGGRTTSPIWRSSIKLSQPAWRPPSSRPNFDGLDTRFEWRSVGCREAWCMENSRPAKETMVDENYGIKTWSKPISSGATSIRETWRDMPWTDQNGEAQFTKLLPTSKRLDTRNSLLPERDTTEQTRQWSQQLTSSASTVQDSVPLGWGCGATSVFIDELQNANVIIGTDGQLPMLWCERDLKRFSRIAKNIYNLAPSNKIDKIKIPFIARFI